MHKLLQLTALGLALFTLGVNAAESDRASSEEQLVLYEKIRQQLAAEGTYTAHDFFKACTSENSQDRLACFMYVNGYVRAIIHSRSATLASNKLDYCIPEETTPNDVARKFFTALETPKATSLGEPKLVAATEEAFTSLMLSDIWPCAE